jgi:long-chain acyl-CoA synthetase
MDDAGNLLGSCQVGEIVHRGPNAMLGYFKDPKATAEAQKFGWHHTGDLGMGRAGPHGVHRSQKDMIKTGGENVASVKVEAVVLAHRDRGRCRLRLAAPALERGGLRICDAQARNLGRC